MLITLKVDDVNIPNRTAYIYAGNFGHCVSLDELKEFATNTDVAGVIREFLLYTCMVNIRKAAKLLGVSPKDMTMTQIKTAIEKEVEL